MWKLALLLQEGDHIGAALGNVPVAELGATSSADMVYVRKYADGGKSTPDTVRITSPDTTVARVIALGRAMADLAAFVPAPVQRIVFDQTGLGTMVDQSLVGTLKDYYTDFTPTLENPAEQAPLLALLSGGLTAFAPLKGWVHDLHVFTPKTRTQLVANVADRSRKKPVLLILMSGLDWNGAFLQAQNLEAAALNNKNLALIVQGAKDLVDEKAWVDKVADDYGQIPTAGGKGRLGQVVIAGHGQATLVEQTTPGTGATARSDEQTVAYTQADLQPAAPGDPSEQLIDELLLRMDPKQARVVFAGCLVGSHDVPETPTLANVATAGAEITAALKANPNLRDIVNERMKTLKIKGIVQASNASTTFSAFNLNKANQAQLSLPGWDPDVGGTKQAYVKTGVEPEGALRAALETWADPKLGPAWTTQAMKDHVAATAASKDWWASLTRTAFTLALPSAGNVVPSVIDDLAHRAEAWLLTGWQASADAAALAANVKPVEAPILYPVMLASDHAADPTNFPHIRVVVEQAWMQVDNTREAAFMAAIDSTPLKRVALAKLLDAGLVDPHLPALLAVVPPAAPTKAQLLLALTIAVDRGSAMPAAVKTMLVNAAGGASTTSFPAALSVPALLDGASELTVLRAIGLAPGAAAAAPVATPDKANLDQNADRTNETFVTVKPHLSIIAGPKPVEIRASPDVKAPVVDTYNSGDQARVVGMSGGWTVVDRFGKIGWVVGPLP